MLVRITAGPRGIGQVLDMPTAQAQARIAAGTAVAVVEGRTPETTALDPAERHAVAPAQHAPKRKPERKR
jgi:hypothetical protein